MKRRLFPVRDIEDAADECADAVRGELAQLADDLNDGLSPDFEVTLIHLDTVDYLAFSTVAETVKEAYADCEKYEKVTPIACDSCGYVAASREEFAEHNCIGQEAAAAHDAARPEW